MALDWRTIDGNEPVFHRVCDLIRSGDAVAFVGAGASAGLYPLWGELINELAREAVARGATDADYKFWLANLHQAPDDVVDGIRRRFDEGTFADLLRKLFRPRSGPDRRYFTPLQGSLIQIPFKGYITTNYDPGLLEARNKLRSDIASTGFGTWRDTDIVIRWQNDEIFRDHPCPLLFAHGIYERADTIVLDAGGYREAYGPGPFRRLLESIWRQRRLVFVGFGFTDPWIRAVAQEGLFAGTQQVSAQHFSLLGLREETPYTPEMRRTAGTRYGAEVLFYPVERREDGREDHSALHGLLGELGKFTRTKAPGSASPRPRAAPRKAKAKDKGLVQRWVHETTEDEHFTGRKDDLSRLDRWAADPEVRAIAVTGMGGLGKTSLVAHWVRKSSGRLNPAIKGILFWSIYANRDVDELFKEIVSFAVSELAVEPPRGRPTAATVMELMRRLPLLLVIDGLELLQDMPSEPGYGAFLRDELRELLDAVCRPKHQCLVLLTSRFPFADLTPYLGRGLRALDLEHLTPTEGAALLAECEVGGTQIEREALSNRFNGHPLGLRLLALAVRQHGDRAPGLLIDEMLGAGGLSDAVPLERKLKSLLDFYERGMPRPAVALLGLVSFFRSLAPTETILALARGLPALAEATEGCTDSDLQATLEELRHQNLLISDPQTRAWSCHPVLREHFRQSLLEWAPGLGTNAAVILSGRPSPLRPKSVTEIEPVMAAIELLLDANDTVGADQLFIERLADGNAFRQLAASSEGMRCALAFIKGDRRHRVERILGRKRLADYLKHVGVFGRESGEFEFGARYFSESAAIYRANGMKAELGITLQNWTGLLVILGRLLEADQRARDAVAVAREVNADAEARGALTYLGTIAGLRGRIPEALAAFDAATELEHRLSATVAVRSPIEGLFGRRGLRLAELMLRLGRVEDARRLTTSNLRICTEKEWREEAAHCWRLLGHIEMLEGNLTNALAQLDVAEGVFRTGRTVSQIPRTLILRAELELKQGNRDRAQAAIDEALTLAAPRQMCLDHAEALLLRARDQVDAAISASAPPEAAAHRAGDDARAALAIARRCGYAWAERDALFELARSSELLGERDRAAQFRQQASLLADRLRDPRRPS